MRKDAIVIKDSKDVRNIFIQINLKENKTSVFSGFSAWENLAFIMEALAVTAEKCIKEGMTKNQVYGAIKKYMTQVLGQYQILKSSDEDKK